MRIILFFLPLLFLSCETRPRATDAVHLYRYEFPMLTDGCYQRLKYVDTKCALMVGFKHPLACEGTICPYLYGGPHYIIDEGHFASVLLVYKEDINVIGRKSDYDEGLDHVKAVEGDLLARVSGRVTYRYGGPTGRVTLEFKDAPMILVKKKEYRTREECRCDEEEWPRE